MHVNRGTYTQEEKLRIMNTANTCTLGHTRSHTDAYIGRNNKCTNTHRHGDKHRHLHTGMQRETDASTDRERTYVCRDNAYGMLHAHRDIDIHGNTHKHELTNTETEVHTGGPTVTERDRYT
jgi:hypothetical protein